MRTGEMRSISAYVGSGLARSCAKCSICGLLMDDQAQAKRMWLNPGCTLDTQGCKERAAGEQQSSGHQRAVGRRVMVMPSSA